MPRKYPVRLDATQRAHLEALLTSGVTATRTLTHARILLKADEGESGPSWKNATIAEAFEVSTLTVTRVRKRFVAAGLEAALQRKVQVQRKAPCLDGTAEAHLLALACSAAPTGRERWTLRLLAGQMVELGYVEAVSYETVRRVLKRGN